MESFEDLLETGPQRIALAESLDELEAVEGELIGKRSAVAETRRTLGTLPPEDRPVVGARLAAVTGQIQGMIATRREALQREAEDRLLREDAADLTLPLARQVRGSQHLITTIIDEVSDIFAALGYRVATGPEAETGWHNFDALNTPPTHPSRQENDTLYLDYGDPADEILLRTQTSPMQIRHMLANEPPVYVVVPGRTFRADTLDATHSPVFHQIEGLAVDTDISLGDLKGTLAHFAREFFGPGREIRLLPDFFPFTEPSAEMLVSCFNCEGGDPSCRVCRGAGWIELMGCGMVDPAVLSGVGYDPDVFSGFAFGVGVERLAMVRHGITHIRHFFENDVRVLEQFR